MEPESAGDRGDSQKKAMIGHSNLFLLLSKLHLHTLVQDYCALIEQWDYITAKKKQRRKHFASQLVITTFQNAL